MSNDPTQYIRDPATGELIEGRWVCPSCKTVNVGVRCGYQPCRWVQPVPSISDDTGEFVPLAERPKEGTE